MAGVVSPPVKGSIAFPLTTGTLGEAYPMHGAPPSASDDVGPVARTTTADGTNDSNAAPWSFRRKGRTVGARSPPEFAA